MLEDRITQRIVNSQSIDSRMPISYLVNGETEIQVENLPQSIGQFNSADINTLKSIANYYGLLGGVDGVTVATEQQLRAAICGHLGLRNPRA